MKTCQLSDTTFRVIPFAAVFFLGIAIAAAAEKGAVLIGKEAMGGSTLRDLHLPNETLPEATQSGT